VIVDTSVIIAILRDEPDAAEIREILGQPQICRMSAVNYVEAGVVVDSNRNPVLSRRLDDLLRVVQIGIEPVTVEQARIAREAYRDFGKGRHRAGLNLGDSSLMPWRRRKARPSYSREMIFATPIFNRSRVLAAKHSCLKRPASRAHAALSEARSENIGGHCQDRRAQ